MPKRIFVAGHNGMVGSAIVRQLSQDVNNEIIVRPRVELDLVDQKAVQLFFDSERCDEVYLAAAKVGGIYANNTFPADFIYQNLMIQNNVINSAFKAGVKKLLFLGSSCIYPKLADQPMSEEALLTGLLEPTNEPYAIAKIAGIKLCESYSRQHCVDYRSVMPTNLYGPKDNFHPNNSHVIPALIRRFHEAKLNNAKEVIIWGTGAPKREFLFVDDMASASVHIMNLKNTVYREKFSSTYSHVNIGTGKDCTILELAETIRKTVGFEGALTLDTSKPDGAPRKLMNVSKLNSLGWHHSVELQKGIENTYQWFLGNVDSFREK